MIHHRLATLALAAGLLVPRVAAAQQAKELYVPPSGGTYEVLVHPAFVTALLFPEKLNPRAIASDIRQNYDVRPAGDDGISVRPLRADAAPANLNLATASGSMRVSVVLRVVSSTREAYTLVSFKATTEEQAVQQRVADAVARKTAALRAELDRVRADVDRQARERAERLIAQRALGRLEIQALDAVERNDDNVIVRAKRAVFFGEDALLYFEIQNRDRNPYRLARVQVLDGKKNVAGSAELASDAQAPAPGLVGIVAAGGRARGVVVIRQAGLVLRHSLSLVVAEPGDRDRVVVDRIVLR